MEREKIEICLIELNLRLKVSLDIWYLAQKCVNQESKTPFIKDKVVSLDMNS